MFLVLSSTFDSDLQGMCKVCLTCKVPFFFYDVGFGEM